MEPFNQKVASEIWHSCTIRNPEHDKIKIHMAESEETFKFSVHETLKDLSQNGKHIDLKPEQESSPWTGFPYILHCYRRYPHVASQSLTPLFKIRHVLRHTFYRHISTVCQDMFSSLQVLASEGKSLTDFVNMYCAHQFFRPADWLSRTFKSYHEITDIISLSAVFLQRLLLLYMERTIHFNRCTQTSVSCIITSSLFISIFQSSDF